MERTARGRYETSLDDPDFPVDPMGNRFAALYLGDEADGPAVFPLEVGPDYKFPIHYHRTHYMSIILRGSLRVGKRWYKPGDIRMQEYGSVYGPEEAGPEGCYMLNVFADRRGCFPSLLGEETPEPIDLPAFIQLSKTWTPLNERETSTSAS